MGREQKLVCMTPDCGCSIFPSVSITLDETDHGTLTLTCEKGHISWLRIHAEKKEVVPTTMPAELTYRTKVSGVTFDNPDGTNRQNLLKYIAAGDELSIDCEKVDEKSIYVVRHAIGVIGTLRTETVKEFTDHHPERKIRARVLQRTGGQGDKTIIGCNIELYAEEVGEKEAASAGPTKEENAPVEFVYMDPNRRDIFHADRYCSGMKNAKRVARKYAEKTLKARPCKRCAAKQIAPATPDKKS